MKILVFSDSHLTEKVDRRINILENLLGQVDQVIINGDFWEGYLITFDRFVNSPWRRLFPLLKKKKTVYIYGNHDKKLLADNRVGLFSEKQTISYKLRLNGKMLIFEHGNRIVPAIDDLLRLKKLPKLIQYPVRTFHDFMIKKHGRKFINFVFRRFGVELKKRLGKVLQKNQVYVCGHTHYAEVDIENGLVNSGIFRSGLAQYLILENSKISLNEQLYQ